VLTTPYRKILTYYEMYHKASDFGKSFGTTYTMENGREIWKLECE